MNEGCHSQKKITRHPLTAIQLQESVSAAVHNLFKPTPRTLHHALQLRCHEVSDTISPHKPAYI
jgi:hypothetical protein